MRAISFIYMLKELKIQMYLFFPESIQELLNCSLLEKSLAYFIVLK